jgi:Nickel responsive protein SCO4226-like
MTKYVIERPMPGVGSSTRDELHAASARSCAALDQLGPDIQWVHSYVTDDKIYCVYLAETEQLVRDHARIADFPAVKISAVRAIIDPTMRFAATAAAVS